MAAVTERVAYVEGRLEEHNEMINGIRDAVVHLEQRMDCRFEIVEAKMSHQFMWMVGIQVTTLVAIVAALLSR